METRHTQLAPSSESSLDSFVSRHIGPSDSEIQAMLGSLGVASLDELTDSIVPKKIQSQTPLHLKAGLSEKDALQKAQTLAQKNQLFRSFLGMGYSDCFTPPVIQRNILENPGWYTQYTPYQAEIAQGRLEALLNFQTLIIEMTGLPVANASLLDEATAAAEAMSLCWAASEKQESRVFFVSENCHPQTLAVIQTRADALGIPIVVGDHRTYCFSPAPFGVLLSYPASDGEIFDYREWIQKAHEAKALVVMACDLMSLALITPPGELGADIAIGNSQRFGVPLGYGGPHAAFLSVKENLKRLIPGRIVGVSKDRHGRPAIRLALQTREQHIRRDRATSNICTAQALLAVMASMYAIYHGPKGIRRIAQNIHQKTCFLKTALTALQYDVGNHSFFDTLRVSVGTDLLNPILAHAYAQKINLRIFDSKTLGISLAETTTEDDLSDLIGIFAQAKGKPIPNVKISDQRLELELSSLKRTSPYLTHPIFNTHHSETQMLRYLFRLQAKDLSLAHSMIPLGSCTMKLNATSEMIPVSWPGFSQIHPFVPLQQTEGYQTLFEELEQMIQEVTGFAAVSLQPNAGSQGEYAGLLVIKKYHESRGEAHRNVCLIPKSAHGTNPASAAMAGFQIVVVECDSQGNIDQVDLKTKVDLHARELSALMITYPSTHGVFEETITEVCQMIHDAGGQVYMDGANMNAQIGLCRPGEFGPDVCHLNLHKTFCIPHGGGGPGMGPIAVAQHLAEFLPSHPVVKIKKQAQQKAPVSEKSTAVSAAPWGSASILPISWMYMTLMGPQGLKKATQVAILNANYIARKLAPHYPVLYRGKNGWVAHECIFDLRQFKESCGVEVEDVAKRLMDYGFHAPTVSFPVGGTMMVEPTESESKAELDRFCEAMISIRQEIREIEEGKADRQSNLLKNAPHTAEHSLQTEWTYAYSRERAVYPLPWVRESKFWPSVGRINNVLGDKNLICACLPVEAYSS
ncbi:MAG: aminomethyl-transferring glycine dehydrogenase [Bdellovibrionia bacterium]